MMENVYKYCQRMMEDRSLTDAEMMHIAGENMKRAAMLYAEVQAMIAAGNYDETAFYSTMNFYFPELPEGVL